MKHSFGAEDLNENPHFAFVVIVVNHLPGYMLRRRCVTLFVNCELVKKLWQQSENPGINGDTGTSSGHASERSCQEDTWQPSCHKSTTSLLSTVSSETGHVQHCFHSNSLRYLRNFCQLVVGGSHSSSVSFQTELW